MPFAIDQDVIQALAPKRAVEGFDEGVVDRLRGPAEVQLDPVPVRPVIQRLRRELGAVVPAESW